MKSVCKSGSYPSFLTRLRDLQNKVIPARVNSAKDEATLDAYVELLVDLETVQEDLEGVIKVLKEECQWLRTQKIPEILLQENQKTVTLESGHRVTRTTRVVASIISGAREEAYKWLIKRKAGSLIQKTVNASALSAYFKEELAQGKDHPTNLFSVSVLDGISLTRAK